MAQTGGAPARSLASVPSPSFTLTGGDTVVIRPIRPDDKARLQAGLRRLSEDTIRRRFLSAKPRFTSAELRYLTEVDGHDHIALVAVDGQGDLVGVARTVRLPDRPHTAEMAIVVGDHLQGQGLGRELAQRIADAALAQGIRYFAATMLGENLPARRLVRAIARRFEQDRANGPLHEVVAELAVPTIGPRPAPQALAA